MNFCILSMVSDTRLDFSGLGSPINLPKGVRSRSMALGRMWILFGSRKNSKRGKILAVGAARRGAAVPSVRCTPEDRARSFYTRETGQQLQKYTPKRQARKPYKAMETCVDHSLVVHLGFRSQ